MANTKTSTYSADEVTLSLAGQIMDSGYAEGEFVSVEPQSEGWTDKVGADGEVARAKVLDRRATAKVKLLQTSAGNALLMALYNSDANGANGAGVGVFVLRDRGTGEDLVRADHAWVMKLPTISRGKEIVEYEWTIRLASTTYNIAGAPAVV